MRYAFKSSFDRAFKKLHSPDQEKAESSMNELIDFFERRIPQPVGLGLKPIGKKYWEIRSDIRTRVLFRIEGDLVTFYFIGNHDQIRRFV